MSFS
ncbi:8c098e06-e095-4340-b684-5904d3dd79bf [Thermothielavioides terrestris]|jgi:phosphoribosylpyrophosphate synthetase